LLKPQGRNDGSGGKDPRSTAGMQCRKGIEMESGVVEVEGARGGRKWARVREGGGGEEEEAVGGNPRTVKTSIPASM